MKTTVHVLVAVAFAVCVAGTLNAGWNVHPGGITAKQEFYDMTDRDYRGNPIYTQEQPVHYRVVLINSLKKNYHNLPVVASLHWAETVSCVRASDNQIVTYNQGDLLPGDSVSGPHYLSIDGISYSFFDGFYSIPNSLCPGNVRIVLDTDNHGKATDSMVLPIDFVIR